MAILDFQCPGNKLALFFLTNKQINKQKSPRELASVFASSTSYYLYELEALSPLSTLVSPATFWNSPRSRLLFLMGSCSWPSVSLRRAGIGHSLRAGKLGSVRRPLAPQLSPARAPWTLEMVPGLAGVGMSEENTDPQRPGLLCQASGSDAWVHWLSTKKSFFLSPFSGSSAWIEALGWAAVDGEG